MAVIYNFQRARTATVLKKVSQQAVEVRADMSPLISNASKIGQKIEATAHLLTDAVATLTHSQQTIISSLSFADRCSAALDSEDLDDMVKARDRLLKEMKFREARGASSSKVR